jgi:hypothetical protein
VSDRPKTNTRKVTIKGVKEDKGEMKRFAWSKAKNHIPTRKENTEVKGSTNKRQGSLVSKSKELPHAAHGRNEPMAGVPAIS